MPSFRPPCIHEAHFRHRGASVSGFLRPSATVAAWHPGPAALVRGKASIPPGVVSTGSGASVRRDLPGFVSASRSSMPGERRKTIVFCPLFGVNRPGFIPRRSGSRRCYSQIQTKCKEKQPPPQIPGSGRCRSTFQAVFSVERPLAWSVKKIIAVAPAALAVRPGSSFSRRQPARLRPAPIRITPRRSLLQKTAARSRHRP